MVQRTPRLTEELETQKGRPGGRPF